jgi:hypothetical protein
MAQEKKLTQSQKDGNSSQVPYYSATDACDSLGTVVPASMAYNQKQFANKLKVAIQPSIHEFVMNRLKYKDYDDFCKAFGREQIDAIANAIYNFENTGFGIIVADQTGVGKGRIGAGLIRYAIEHLGKMPIFVTDKAHLINDMYRDLVDIGYQANAPQQVKVNTKDASDLTDSELERYILKDLDESEMLRVDISEYIDDPEFNPYNLFTSGKNRDNLDSKTLEIISNAGLDIDGVREFIKDEYRNYIAMNGVETYDSNWKITKDENYGLSNGEVGDNYDKLLDREFKRGRKMVKPFILHSNINIKDENGNLLFRETYNKNAVDTKRLSSEYKAVMTTYSQFSRAFDKTTLEPTPKFDLIRSIVANDGILILDESHKASGIAPNGELTNTGRALTDLISLAKDVIYISATYAKEPKNMFLYSEKTAIREAELNYAELIQAFRIGDKALQEASASELTAVGHLVRRERPIVGKTEYLYTDANSEKGIEQIEAFERFRNAMNHIKEFQKEVQSAYSAWLDTISNGDKELKAQLKERYPYSGNISMLSFNTVQSFLLGLKVNQTIDVTINHLQSGKKTVIAVANTMESIFDNIKKDYISGTPYNIGDYIEDDLGLVFGYLIWYCLKVKEGKMTVVQEDGRAVERMVFEERHISNDCPYQMMLLRSELMSRFEDMLRNYKGYRVYLPLSPIDRITNGIKSKGYSITEITKRKRKLSYDKNNPSLAKLEKRKVPNVTDAIKEFNQNKIDALVLNRSGAVGVSMHSKPNSVAKNFDKNILKIENLDDRVYPKSLEPRDEVKARVMIITQMETDINNEVQKLGRISRTGQIYSPEYNYIFSCLPLEKRFASMMERKMRSLMANVSAEQTQGSSQFSFDDLLSKTGGECVISPANSIAIQIPQGLVDNPSVETVDFVLKQLYWKSVEQQELFYNVFLRDFEQKLKEKIANGTYTEKVLLKNYGAKTIDVLPITLGIDNPFSSFGFPVFAELMDIEVFTDKNYSKDVADKIGRKMLTLPDGNGNQVPIQSIDTYREYIKNVNNEYFEKSVKSRAEQDIQRLNDNIASAEAQVNELSSRMEGYEDFSRAESIITMIGALNKDITDLANEIPNLAIAGNQDQVTKNSALIQQKQNEIQELQNKFDSQYKEIYEKKDEFRDSLRTIKSLNDSIDKNKVGLEKLNNIMVEQAKIHDAFNLFVDKLGNVFNFKTYREDVVDTTDENGVAILEMRTFEYTLVTDEQVVLSSIDYPFQQRAERDYTYGNLVLCFTPAFGGFIYKSLASFYEEINEGQALQGKKHEYEIVDTNKNYIDVWDKYVEGAYAGVRENKVFLTGSTLKAISHAKSNALSGGFVKFSTAQGTERIGFELTRVASEALERQFNNASDFPLGITITDKIVEGSIYYKFNSIIESLKKRQEEGIQSNYYQNFYYNQILTFELTDKTKIDYNKSGSDQLQDLSLLELKYSKNRNDVLGIENLDAFINSPDLFFRVVTTNDDLVLELLGVCKSLGLTLANDYEALQMGQYRPFQFIADRGSKPYSLSSKNKSRQSEFVREMDYDIRKYNSQRHYQYSNYDYHVQDNIFVSNNILRYEISNNSQYIGDWYKMKYGLDISVKDFLTLIDYLNKQGMGLKSVLSYGLLKDSGNFVFDMDSYQRAFTVIEANGEGVIESDLSEEQEATIDQRIEDLIDLFRI